MDPESLQEGTPSESLTTSSSETLPPSETTSSSFFSNKNNWIILILIFIALISFTYYVLFVQKGGKPKLPRNIAKSVVNWNRYTDAQYGFSFYYPKDWSVEPGSPLTVKEIAGDKKITIQKLPNSSDLKPSQVMANTVYKKYMQNNKTNPYLSDIEVSTITIGIKKPYIITNVKTPDETLGPQVWIPSEELFISANKPFEQNDKTFNTMITSFTFKKPQESFLEKK